MGTWIGVAFAMVLARGPTNGLDPNTLMGIYQAGVYIVDSQAFREWLEEDPNDRADAVKYFVYCALDEHQVISVPRYGTWRGGLGLAPSALPKVGTKGGRWSFQFGGGKSPKGGGGSREGGGEKGLEGGGGAKSPEGGGQAKRLEGPADEEQKWVSSCLVAYTNMKRSHQYISLRGNPPNDKARAKLDPDPAVRWTMGYPEGVFFADLFWNPNPGVHAAEEDLRSFTASMNLPKGYAEQGAAWRPPNAALGRTLDYAAETRVEAGDSRPLIARKLGTYHEHLSSFGNPTSPSDPVYKADKVCVRDEASPTTTTLVPCHSPEAEILRPLFVHLPRLANLESAEKEVDSTKAFQVIDRGTPPTAQNEVRHCTGQPCIGAFFPLASAATPQNPTPPGHGKRLLKLSPEQVLEPTLRFLPGLETPPLKPPPSQPYTAIIRYTSLKASRAGVSLQKQDGTWSDTKDDVWPATISCDANYEWLQVYPVYPDGKSVLRIRILGKEGPAPELDAVGFVPGKPWCAPSADTFMGVCH